MIDPVGSGYSRPAKADGGSAFWGVQRDANAMAKVIALWLTNNRRAESPKYLVGESYGGFRAAKVARALRRDQGITVSGIVMVSPLLEGAFTFGGTRFALGAAMQIPSLAAAALERKGEFSHGKLAEAERFALNEYLTTLAGPPPRGEAARAFYARVAEITGMPLDIVVTERAASSATPMSSICAATSARSSAATTRRSRGRTRIRNPRARAVPTRCSTAWCAPIPARSPPMRARN